MKDKKENYNITFDIECYRTKQGAEVSLCFNEKKIKILEVNDEKNIEGHFMSSGRLREIIRNHNKELKQIRS